MASTIIPNAIYVTDMYLLNLMPIDTFVVPVLNINFDRAPDYRVSSAAYSITRRKFGLAVT